MRLRIGKTDSEDAERTREDSLRVRARRKDEAMSLREVLIKRFEEARKEGVILDKYGWAGWTLHQPFCSEKIQEMIIPWKYLSSVRAILNQVKEEERLAEAFSRL
jgi:hypothetical protein